MFPTAFVRSLASRVAVLSLAALSGCAAMDDFSWRKMNFEVFRTPDKPFEVAAKSTDGAERVRALRVLQEPLKHGGTQKDQDAYVLLLNHTAGADPNPLCRMAAIECMRGYTDPRVVDGLKDAYYHAGGFHADVATVLRRQALAALGDVGNPAGVKLLLDVLREPPAEGADVDKDARMQERIAAARALAKFHGMEVKAALAAVMAKDDDLALQRRAHESLVAITGKDMPADAKAWNDYLNSPAGKEDVVPAGWWHRPVMGDTMMRLTGLK